MRIQRQTRCCTPVGEHLQGKITLQAAPLGFLLSKEGALLLLAMNRNKKREEWEGHCSRGVCTNGVPSPETSHCLCPHRSIWGLILHLCTFILEDPNQMMHPGEVQVLSEVPDNWHPQPTRSIKSIPYLQGMPSGCYQDPLPLP